MRKSTHAALLAALAGVFCTAGCSTLAPTPVEPPAAAVSAGAPGAATAATEASALPATPVATTAAEATATTDPRVVVPEQPAIVPVQPTSEPRYAAPESLRQFRFAQKNQPDAVLAKPPGKRAAAVAASPANQVTPASPARDDAMKFVEVEASAVVPVQAAGEGPRYQLPDSLKEWRAGRKVPLYEDPEAAPWQASPTEPRLRNAAVSCNYKDEGGIRGRVALLVDDFKVTRFNARIEMPNGGICVFDSKKMEQRPFEQGIALQSKGDECVVRMWEQKHRITIAAYSCHKQCSKGSFSYLWPILMDTRIGTCY